MAFKEVADLYTNTTIALGGMNKKSGKANPTTITGYYLGFREAPSHLSKSGLAKVHIFQTPQGNVGVWGKTDLDRKLAQVTVGALTRATMTGTQAFPGKAPMYVYKVEQDSDDAVEAPSAPAAQAAAYEADDAQDDLPIGTEEEEEFVAPPARKPAVAAQAPDAERIAAMKARLAGIKRA